MDCYYFDSLDVVLFLLHVVQLETPIRSAGNCSADVTDSLPNQQVVSIVQGIAEARLVFDCEELS